MDEVSITGLINLIDQRTKRTIDNPEKIEEEELEDSRESEADPTISEMARDFNVSIEYQKSC